MWERRLARWLFLGVPTLLVLAVGGVVPWAEWTALAALVAASLLHVLHRARAGKGAFLSPLALGGLAALGLSLLAALPLPPGLVELLSPLAAEAQQGLARVSGHEAGGWPLSLDAVSSLRGSRRLAIYLLVFLLAVPLGRKPDTLRQVMRGFGALGVAFVGVAVLNVLAGDGSIAGLYRPSAALYRGAATFVNPNHAAALLGLTLPVTVALLATGRGKRSMVVWGAGALAQFALLLLTPSGNALVAPVFLTALAAVFVARQRRHVSPRGQAVASVRLVLFAGLAVVIGLVVLQTAFEPLRAVVADAARFDKLRTIQAALSLVPRSPWVGLGPGAFLFGFGAYGPTSGLAFTAPESLPVQALLDFGLPAGLALMALPLAGLWMVAKKAHEDSLRVGLAVALLGFVVHELADFAIDLPATGAVFFAVFGLAVGASDAHAGRLALRRVRVRRLALLLAGVAALGAAGGWLGEQALPRRALLAWRPETGQPAPVPLDDVRALGRFFPLDGRVWMRVGVAEQAAGRTDAGRAWLEHAARVMPQSARVLETLARSVRGVAPERHAEVVRQMAARFWTDDGARGFDAPIDFVLGELARDPTLRESPRALLGDSTERVKRYLRTLADQPLSVRKSATAALLREYGASLPTLLLLERPLRDPELAQLRTFWTTTLFTEHPQAPETWAQLSLDAARKGNLERALALQQKARALRGAPDAVIGARLVELYLKLGRVPEAAAALTELDGLPGLPASRREVLKARLAVAQDRTDAALTLVEHLLIDEPRNLEALALRAKLLADTGRWSEAREAYLKLHRLTDRPGYKAQADRLQKKLTPAR